MSLISKDFVKIFVAGMLVGIIMSWLFDFMLVSPNKYEENIHTQLEVLKQDEIIKQHSQSEIGLSDDLVQLNAKIYRLENELNEMRRKEASNDSHAALKNRTTVALTITKLIEAGIDEYLAEEIISNREASEYQ